MSVSQLIQIQLILFIAVTVTVFSVLVTELVGNLSMSLSGVFSKLSTHVPYCNTLYGAPG